MGGLSNGVRFGFSFNGSGSEIKRQSPKRTLPHEDIVS
jgi:hypothetical protein